MASEKLISEGSDGSDNNSIVVEGQDTNQGSFIQCGYGCGFADGDGRAADIEKRSSSTKRLWSAVVLCVLFMSVEVAGGLMANSLAILTDAAHLLLDVAGFAISLFAIWASGWEATPRQTYGFHRLEILGALMSIQLIWLLTGVVVYEAIYRLFHENKKVNGLLMFTVAAFGFVVNLLMTFVLGHDHGHNHSHGHGHDHKHNYGHDHHHHHHGEKQEHSHGKHHKCDKDEHGQSDNEHQDEEPLLADCEHEHWKNVVTKSTEESVIVVNEDIEIRSSKKHETHKNINMEGAYLHVLGDLIQSIGVMIGGAIIWAKPEWKVVDLICTLLFSALVLVTTVKMLRSILEVLMESTPREIDATELENGLLSISGVLAVHELHIWAITVGKVLLACHVKIEQDGDADRILKEVILYCEKDYKISHVTVQIERDL